MIRAPRRAAPRRAGQVDDALSAAPRHARQVDDALRAAPRHARQVDDGFALRAAPRQDASAMISRRAAAAPCQMPWSAPRRAGHIPEKSLNLP